MGKHKRGGYLFYTWQGDHLPRHAHVEMDDRVICKWNLEKWKLMSGRINKRILKALEELRQEGLI
ncbi:MAG: DUF4160 domain-containing protein [Deltaproteobacteria bacterium]|nr:DUF4160 domain-containing protein [Deltaproteobacteria bacterium]